MIPYVQFTYFNIFSQESSGSFTKICDVALLDFQDSRRPGTLKSNVHA